MNRMGDDRSYSGLVQKYIGSAYDKVAAVADNLEELLNVEDVILKFYSQYYGPRDTAPLTRPDGSPITDGDLYFNTDVQHMFYWKLDVWTPLGIHTNEIETYTLTDKNFHGNVAFITMQTPYVPGSNSLVVFRNHMHQVALNADPQGQYNEVNPLQIAFPNGIAQVGDKVSLIIGTTYTSVNPIIDIIKKHTITVKDLETYFLLPDGMHYITGSHNLEVYVDGALKILGHDYLETSPTEVTFLHGLPLGSDVLFKKGEIVSNSGPGQPHEGDIVSINHLGEFFYLRSLMPHTVAIYAKGETLPGDGRAGFYLYNSAFHCSLADGFDIIDDHVAHDQQGTGTGTGCWIRQYATGVKKNEADIIAINAELTEDSRKLKLHIEHLDEHGNEVFDRATAHPARHITYDDLHSSLGANTVKVALDKISHYNHFGIHAYAVKVDETVQSGTIWGDVNATDFSAHNEDYGFVQQAADLAALDVHPTYLHIDQHHIVTFYDGANAYRYVGRNNRNIGIGGEVCDEHDFVHVGTGVHELLSGRDEPDQHEIAAITGLQGILDNLFNETDFNKFFEPQFTKRLKGMVIASGGPTGTIMVANNNINDYDKLGFYVVGNGRQTPLPADLGSDSAVLLVFPGGSRILQILYGIDGSSAHKIWTRGAPNKTSWTTWGNVTDAGKLEYDNTASGLASTTVQAALDELTQAGGHGSAGTAGATGAVAANTVNIAANKSDIALNTQKLDPADKAHYHRHEALGVDYRSDNHPELDHHIGSGLGAKNVQEAIDKIVHYNAFGIYHNTVRVNKLSATSKVWDDVNAMDFSGHLTWEEESQQHDYGRALLYDQHHMLTIHDGSEVYRFVGASGKFLLGLDRDRYGPDMGGHTCVEGDLLEVGTGDHAHLSNLNRINQHSIPVITGLQNALNKKANVGHSHDPHDVDAYTKIETDTKLNKKAERVHTHTVAQISDLAAKYYTKVDTDKKITAGTAGIAANTRGVATNKANIAKGVTATNAAKALTVVNKTKITALTAQIGELNSDMFIDNKENVIIGHRGSGLHITGDHNVVLGTGSLKVCRTSYNVAIGYAVAPKLAVGLSDRVKGENVFMGWGCAFELLKGGLNAFVGRHAGYEITESEKTVLMGWYAGQYSHKTDSCTFLGAWAGDCSHTHGVGGGTAKKKHTNVSCLGYRSQIYADNSITLGGMGNTNGSMKVTSIFSPVSGITRRSDVRDKTDITPLGLGLDFISKIEPISYRLDLRDHYVEDRDSDVLGDNSSHKFAAEETSIGVKAQQVEEVCDELGVEFPGLTKTKDRGDNELYHINYTEFVPALIQAVKELKAEVDTLKAAQA